MDVMTETEVCTVLFSADEEVVDDAEVEAENKVLEVCCCCLDSGEGRAVVVEEAENKVLEGCCCWLDSEEGRAVAVDVSTKVVARSDGKNELVPSTALIGTEFATLGEEVAMLGESAVAGNVVTENTEILAKGPSPSGMTYGSAPPLPSICISPAGPSVKISPEAAAPGWLSGIGMPAFME